MCWPDNPKPKSYENEIVPDSSRSTSASASAPKKEINRSSRSSLSSPERQLRRRNKRDRRPTRSKDSLSTSATCDITAEDAACVQFRTRIVKKKKRSKMASKHGDESKSGGVEALIPSLVGVVILAFIIMARMGFRGRATVAGVDLGTTNSVVCVQTPSKGVGEIVCIPDPASGSPVVPSVVSFLDNHHSRSFRLTKEERKQTWPDLMPHPVDVVVGQAAKERITSHPHHTVYHAKRIIGREYDHFSVESLKGEVDFHIVSQRDEKNMAAFSFPYHLPMSPSMSMATAVLSPTEIGSYIIHHLRMMTRNHLRHGNIQSAVIAVPAKFGPAQRDATIHAFEQAGMKVARVLEEPAAAALAYGLHKRDDVHHVMIYDFGGGTLDVSLLYIGEGGYIDILGSDGDEQLGGADFDAAVAHWLLAKNGGESVVKSVMASVVNIEKTLEANGYEGSNDVEDLIEELCPKLKKVPLCTLSSFHTIGELMKIELSSHPNDLEVVIEKECYQLRVSDVETVPTSAGELCDQLFEFKLSMTLEEYDVAVDHLYRRSLIPIQRLNKRLGLEKEEIDEVVMVGGTTRMPQIRDLVRHELKKEKLNTHIDPDITVAFGAASVID